jgi:L-iditol 2-dehydrogenase
LKAAVLRALNVFTIEDVPEPAIGHGQVKVRIEYAGLCATDLEILEGTFGLAKGPGWGLPMIMGHECSGTIVEVGAETKLGYKVGQRVACSPLGSCGFCRFCRNGQESFCQNPCLHPGAFTKYVALGEGQVFPILDNVSLQAAAILEPVAIALRTVQRAEIMPGSTVAILGGGAIGSIVVEVAKNAGATTILVSEPVAHKRQLAERLGATTVIDPLNQNLEDAAKEAIEGIGFDAVIDCTGRLAVAQQALSIAGPGAHVVWSAVYPERGEVPVNGFQMYVKDLSIHGVFMAPYLMWKANRMLSTLNLDPIIDFVYPLDTLDTAIADHRAGKVVKALIKP